MKMLYFAVAADNATAYPISALRGIDTAANKLHLYFSPQRITDVAATDNVDKVQLSVGADESIALQNVIEAMNMNAAPFVVISDSEKGKHVVGVTACDSITYAT